MTHASEKPVIGLTGGICSGKSTVAAELAELGCAVIDADAVGHELLEDPEVRDELVRRLGEGILSAEGRPDRERIARIVFDSPEALARLNAVMHPRMRDRMARRIDQLRRAGGCPAVVLDAALLLETDWHELCDTIVFVDAPPAQRLQRAKARGWDADELQRRENSQKPLDTKATSADHVIDNSSSLSYLREQVCSVFHCIHPKGRT